MPSENSKLVATAVGAAAAGAALAVMALKMSESKEADNTYSMNRPSRPTVLMNEPTPAIPDSQIQRTDSSGLLFPHNHEEKMRRRIATRYQIESENSSPRESVTVRVPATSANVGPGCKSSSINLSLLLL